MPCHHHASHVHACQHFIHLTMHFMSRSSLRPLRTQGTIEGRRDIAGGRLMSDRRSAANSTSGQCFSSLAYSADGSFLLAGKPTVPREKECYFTYRCPNLSRSKNQTNCISCVRTGGRSKFVCLYGAQDRILMRRFQLSHNQSLDGVLDQLNSKNVTDAGPVQLLDDDDSADELELLGPAGCSLIKETPLRVYCPCLRSLT